MPTSTAVQAAPTVQAGHGVSIGHHGELFQGLIEDRGGQQHRCLLSLPCNRFVSRATFVPGPGDAIRLPPGKQKAEIAFRLTLEHFETRHVGGGLTFESNIPERKGYGSSTADCVAAVLAAAAALKRSISAEIIARLVVRAEGASDNVMFRRAVLFAQREGVIVEDYLEPLPPLVVLGMDADERACVDTMNFPPPSYSRREIEIFQDLVRLLGRAVRSRDLKVLGAIATASAAMNQRFLPKPMFREIRHLAQCCGALGVAAAHSGTVLSILLDHDDPKLESKIDRIRAELSMLQIRRVMRFETGRAGSPERHSWYDNPFQQSSILTDPA